MITREVAEEFHRKMEEFYALAESVGLTISVEVVSASDDWDDDLLTIAGAGTD